MKKLIFFIALVFISCNSENKTEKQYEEIYKTQKIENNKFNEILYESINQKIIELENSKSQINAIKYDSLTKIYFIYLTNIEKEISENGNEIFFKDNLFSSQGKEFIVKSKNYQIEIGKLINSINLKKRVDFIFGMKDIETKDKIYIHYLDFYFRGYPKIQSVSIINNMKRRILEFENEYLDEQIVLGKTN